MELSISILPFITYMSQPTQNSSGENNVNASTIAKGTVVFSLVAGGYVIALWGGCLLLSPARRIISHLPWQSTKDLYTKSLLQAENSKYLQKIPQAYRARFVVSFAEMLTMKIILGPVALPFKLWLTYEILKYV